jgi:hypothetical protein
MYQNTILLFVVVGFIAFYYFNKFNESEKEYIKLHGSVREMYNENQKLKSKVKELQAYKDDVSKTFKVLDNELVMINDHIQRRQQPQVVQQHPQNNQQQLLNQLNMHSQPSFIPTNRVSLLTPELLNTVFFDIQHPQHLQSVRPTAIINTVVENIPIHRQDNIQQQEQVNMQIGVEETESEIEYKEGKEGGDQIQEVNKSLEEKLDEKALEEMLKSVEMNTMNELLGETNEYNNLLLDLNKFKINNP